MKTLLFTAAISLITQTALAQRACTETTLREASALYELGRFSQVIDVLQPCFPGRFTNRETKIEAFRLMAVTYVATDSLDQARLWTRTLLESDSRYRSDPQRDPLPFSRMVRDLKPRWYSWLWKGNEWYKWAGRGALAAGIASVPLIIQRTRIPDLPSHPDFPR